LSKTATSAGIGIITKRSSLILLSPAPQHSHSRETNGWKWPAFMVGYLFAAAYIMAGITYWLAVAVGL